MKHLGCLLLLVLVGCATGAEVTRDPPSVPPSKPTAPERAANPVQEQEQDADGSDEQGARDPRAFMSFREIWTIIEESPRRYDIIEGVPGTYTNQVWPVGDAPTAAFRIVKDEAGRRRVEPPEALPAASQKRLDRAEEAYKARRFKEAEEGYREVLRRHPDDYTVQLVLGDALLFQDKAAEALAAYERAATLAPRSYSAWFFQASALLRLERFDEAADRYARALALRPAWPSIVQAIESNGRHIGRRIAPQVLKPRARAILKEDSVVVEADPKSFAWTAHAICKAMWLGEAELREARLGNASHAFTYLEEGECLSVLLHAHRSARAKQPDPMLDRALEIAEAGLLRELVSYELLARVVPMAIPTLEDEVIDRLHAYVQRFVLVPTAGDPDGSESVTGSGG